MGAHGPGRAARRRPAIGGPSQRPPPDEPEEHRAGVGLRGLGERSGMSGPSAMIMTSRSQRLPKSWKNSPRAIRSITRFTRAASNSKVGSSWPPRELEDLYPREEAPHQAPTVLDCSEALLQEVPLTQGIRLVRQPYHQRRDLVINRVPTVVGITRRNGDEILAHRCYGGREVLLLRQEGPPWHMGQPHGSSSAVERIPSHGSCPPKTPRFASAAVRRIARWRRRRPYH